MTVGIMEELNWYVAIVLLEKRSWGKKKKKKSTVNFFQKLDTNI